MKDLKKKVKKALNSGRKIILWTGDYNQAKYLAKSLDLKETNYIYLKEIKDFRGKDFGRALMIRYGYWYKKFIHLQDVLEISDIITHFEMEVIDINNYYV